MRLLSNIFKKKTTAPAASAAPALDVMSAFSGGGLALDREECAKLLKTSPETLAAFETAYQKHMINTMDETDPLTGVSVTQLREGTIPTDTSSMDSIINRIVDELLAMTTGFSVKNGQLSFISFPETGLPPVTAEELNTIPAPMRPLCAGSTVCKDCPGESYPALLFLWKKFKETGDIHFYHMFRQGLDILDLDPVLYEMLGQNPTSIENWLPQVTKAVKESDCGLTIPDTTVICVPEPLLQLSRKEYGLLNQTTKDILNRYCMKAFSLDTSKDYFVKTGTYSSKFDFRNAHVLAGHEVTELGEYLLYIQNSTVLAAGPLSQPSIYGMSTTRCWCVREYIAPKEGTPAIYRGMPLRTEFRLFIDTETGEIIGQSPYWRRDIMLHRFEMQEDKGKADMVHDSLIYRMEEEHLTAGYDVNIDRACRCVSDLTKALRDAEIKLPARQWSVDLMLEDDTLYLIDMATAQMSALKDVCGDKLLAPEPEDYWIPQITG